MPKNSLTSSKKSKWLAYLILAVSSFLYIYEFSLRVVISVVSDYLMNDLKLGIHDIGVLSSFFYMSYTIMQIPAGVLVDNFGPKRLLTIGTVICAVSTLIFANTTTFFTATLSRLLLGFGAAFAYCCPLMIAKFWFKPKRFALITGCVQTLGALGAIIGNEPVALMTEAYGWRESLYYIGQAGIIFALLMWLIVKDKPDYYKGSTKTQDDGPMVENMKTVLYRKDNWLIAIMGFCTWAPMTIIAELWGRTYLSSVYGYSLTFASLMISWIWVGVAIGGPLMGWLSNFIHSRNDTIGLSFLISFTAVVCIIYLPILPIWLIAIFLVLFGIAAGGQCVAFGMASDINETHVTGTAIGFVNMAVISGGIILQPFVSFLLENATLRNQHANNQLTQMDFQTAFVIVPLISLLGLFISQWVFEESLSRTEATL